MKTTFLFVFLLFTSFGLLAQVPNIKQRSIKSSKILKSSDKSASNPLSDNEILTLLKSSLQSDVDKSKLDVDSKIKTSAEEILSKIDKINKENLEMEISSLTDAGLKDYLKLLESQTAELDSLIAIIEKAKTESQTEISAKDRLLNELYEIQEKKVMLLVKLNILSNSKKGSGWFPTIRKNSQFDREVFYERMYGKDSDRNYSLINDAVIQFGKNVASYQSELASAYFNFVRVSFGSVITSSSLDEEEGEGRATVTQKQIEEALQRLRAGGGGNFYLDASFPIYHHSDPFFNTTTIFKGKMSLTVQNFSNDVDTSEGSGLMEISNYTSLTDPKKEFVFFLNCSAGGYWGADAFYKSLNITNKSILFLVQGTFGVDVRSSIRLTYTMQTFGSDPNIRTARGLVGVSLLK
jgi:BMFP domain-containing protein YqiC